MSEKKKQEIVIGGDGIRRRGPDPGSGGPRGRARDIEARGYGIAGYDIAGAIGDGWKSPPAGSGFSKNLDGGLTVVDNDVLWLEVGCEGDAVVEVDIMTNGTSVIASPPISFSSGAVPLKFEAANPGEVKVVVERTVGTGLVHVAVYVSED